MVPINKLYAMTRTEEWLVIEGSMPVELVFPESFTDDPFSPAKTVEISMSRKLMNEDLARAKPLEYFHTLFHHHALQSVTTLLYHDSEFGDSKLI